MTDLNPSDLIINDQLVSSSNPVPVSSATAASVQAVVLNPLTLLINGLPVSGDNPLPINFV